MFNWTEGSGVHLRNLTRICSALKQLGWCFFVKLYINLGGLFECHSHICRKPVEIQLYPFLGWGGIKEIYRLTGICLKVKVILELGFELVYFKAAVQHLTYYTTTPHWIFLRYVSTLNAQIQMILFTNPSARAGYDTRSNFKRSLTGFNSEFSFS